ncbi:MAG TPA: hypothetical protein VF585_11650 [Chthoniobacterales bacterium]|jgi:dTDP-4-dehydrorhamnose 3,5-epimerase-like enzyme
MNQELWEGLKPSARALLETKSYAAKPLLEQLGSTGVPIGSLVDLDHSSGEVVEAWIPGVEILPRKVFPQRHRGVFGEFGRKGEGTLGKIGLWPAQWATARMNAGSAKGFHIHPPSIPEGTDPVAWFQRLFVTEKENFALRRYEHEQWDAMFFIQGHVEMLLVDERAGMPRKMMRFFIAGDNHRGPDNAGLVIPAGVAHALRSEGSEDLIMVYGTSTTFRANFEGRLASSVELAPLPADWQTYLDSDS